MSTFTKRIDATIRDLDHTFDGATWTVDQDTAWNLGNPGAVTRNIGLRFTGVNVPKNATINSAKITFIASGTQSNTGMNLRIKGVAEDNTSEFVLSPESSARTRTKTTAVVSWTGTINQTNGVGLDTPDISTIISEIVSRAGWASGNALAIYLYDNGSTSGQYISVDEYGDDTTHAALLTIDYTDPVSLSPSKSPSASPSVSPSVSVSPSLSPSASPSIGSSYSPSVSPSISISPSLSPSVSPSTSLSPSKSPSVSPSISPSVSPEAPPVYGVRVKKPSVNKDVEDITDPKELVFTSAYGVLGLRLLETVEDTTDANGNIDVTLTHNIGYPVITIVTAIAYDNNRVNLPVEWHSIYLNGSRETIEVTETFDFTITANTVNITLHAEEYNHDLDTTANISGRDYTFKVYCYFNELVETY